jgi:hypothetical protein
VDASPSTLDDAQLGVTLFSFTNEWQTGDLTLTQMLQRVAGCCGPGLEVVGGQSFRGFPDIDPEDARAFRDTIDRLELRPTALGVFADYGRRADRMLTHDEVVEDLILQFDAAVTLGFPVVRPALGLDTAVLERIAPALEQRRLTLAMELQGPVAPDAPVLVRTLETFERLQSPALGLTLDFSLFMPDLPVSLVTHLQRRGFGTATIAAFRDGFLSRGAGVEAFPAAAAADGTDPEDVGRCMSWLHRFGHHRPEEWTHVFGWVRHAHAKFWDLEAPERDIVTVHGAFLRMLADAGYEGAIASEWGGNDWLEIDDADAFAISQAHLSLLREILAGMRVARDQ